MLTITRTSQHVAPVQAARTPLATLSPVRKNAVVNTADRTQFNTIRGIQASLFNFAPQRVSFKLEKFEWTQGNAEVKVEYPVISGLSDRGVQDKINAALKENAEFHYEEAVIMSEEFPGDAPFLYSMEFDANSLKQFGNVISISARGHHFMGSGHATPWTSNQNFDIRTGDVQWQNRLFTPDEGHLKVLSDYCFKDLVKQLGAENDPSAQQWIREGTEANGPNFDNYRLTQDGLEVHFRASQVGPYSAGLPTVTVPYNLLNDFLLDDSLISG